MAVGVGVCVFFVPCYDDCLLKRLHVDKVCAYIVCKINIVQNETSFQVVVIKSKSTCLFT